MKIGLPDGTICELPLEGKSIEEILLELKINPVEVIVAKNGHIVSEEEMAGLDDELKIIKVVHGG